MKLNVFIIIFIVSLIVGMIQLITQWADHKKQQKNSNKLGWTILILCLSAVSFFISEAYEYILPDHHPTEGSSVVMQESSSENEPTHTEPSVPTQTNSPQLPTETEAPTEKGNQTEAETQVTQTENTTKPSGNTGSQTKPTTPKPTTPKPTTPKPTTPKPTDPPATTPPATEPPVTEPPTTAPPVTTPPVTEPPVVETTPPGKAPAGYSISLTSYSVYPWEPFLAIVRPDVDDYTKIVIHAIDPTGGKWDFVISSGNTYDLIITQTHLTGTWTLYADVYNQYGTFYGASTGARAELTVKPRPAQ